MTHRPIAPIEINGFEPGGTPRALPIFEWVEPGTLLVDAGYQRDSSERSLKLVRKIVAGWDWAKFKSPVAVLTDAGLELIDGQHTAIAAATHPSVEKIPVMIIEAPERADRAGAFISHNRDRIAVTRTQLHTAAIAAGEEEALAVQRVCAEAGVTILRVQPGSGRYPPATTMSVTAIAALIKARGEISAVKALSCLARGELAPINQTHIRAADVLLNDAEYSSQITSEALSATIQSMGRKVEDEAAVFRAAHPSVSMWKAMAICWFRNRRGPKASSSVPVEKVTTSRNDVIANADPVRSGENYSKTIPAVSGERKPQATSAGYQVCANLQTGKRDNRAALSGWKPGVFLLRCSGCDEKYQGDKRSRSCADCAYGCREAVSA